MTPLKQSPTIRQMTAQRFSDWLKTKYGSQAGLVNAWGGNALDSFAQDGFPASGESIDQRNVLPLGNPWYWDPDNLNGSQAFRKQRLLDTLEFLYELQCAANDRWIAAVRQAGYQGEILGSNWQAGRALSHYANLHTDYRVGLIDRHNYFGGQRRGDKSGKFRNGSMLARAGSATLSTSMQQVIDRPFMLSEWIHVFPNEWGVEGPAVIGAYGFGLQGWDASYMFQNGDSAQFSSELGRSPWDVMAPQVLGVFPAVARQVLRGDVKEADVVAPRNVHVPMQASASGDMLEVKGGAPVLMEPVKAAITIGRPGRARVFLLDHDGRRTQAALPVASGTFAIDGAKDRTPYYLIECD